MRRVILAGLMAGAVGAGCGKPSAEDTPWAEYQVTAAMSTNRILIGEPVDLQVTADHPADVTVQFPRLDGEESVLMVQDQAMTTVPLDPDRSRTRAAYRITALDLGEHVVSSNHVVFVRQDEEVQSRPFPFAALQVRSALTNDQALAGDKDLATWPLGMPRLLVGVALVALLAFAVAGLVAWWMLKRGPRVASAPRLPPAHVTALAAIDQLKAKHYVRDELREPYYMELSGIVRRYIEQRFGIHAPELTTEEFLMTALGSRLLSPPQQELTRHFLEQCDLVKFARALPGVEDMQAALESAVQLIQETRISDAAVAA